MLDIKQIKKGRKVILQTSKIRIGKRLFSFPLVVEIMGKVKGSNTMVNVKEIERGKGWCETKNKYVGYKVAWAKGFPYYKINGTPQSFYQELFEDIDMNLTYRSWSKGDNKDYGVEHQTHINNLQPFNIELFTKLTIEHLRQ